ncbi:MAG: glycine cleavage system protein GcvH [Thermodesulfobacteriota bacterium]
MKELSELVFPNDRKYSQEHEWAKLEGDKVVVGISDFAQDRLGSVVFVEMPQVGAKFSKGDECGTLESTKAVSEIFIPVSGEVVAVNTELEQSPGLVNEDPYSAGWIVEVKPENPAEFDGLLNRDQYVEMLQGME